MKEKRIKLLYTSAKLNRRGGAPGLASLQKKEAKRLERSQGKALCKI